MAQVSILQKIDNILDNDSTEETSYQALEDLKDVIIANFSPSQNKGEETDLEGDQSGGYSPGVDLSVNENLGIKQALREFHDRLDDLPDSPGAVEQAIEVALSTYNDEDSAFTRLD